MTQLAISGLILCAVAFMLVPVASMLFIKWERRQSNKKDKLPDI